MKNVFFLFFLLLTPCYGEKHSPFLPTGSLLHLEINLRGGGQLLLNDNSLWDVDPVDVNISRLWLSPFPMQVTFTGSGPYPYLITNTQSQEKIKARPSSSKD